MKSKDNPKALYNIYTDNQYDINIDNDELNDFFIIDNFNNKYNIDENEEFLNDELMNEIDEQIFNTSENCINCYHSNNGYCSVKNKRVSKVSYPCWFWRDCFTMRSSSDFQDDNDDFNE